MKQSVYEKESENSHERKYETTRYNAPFIWQRADPYIYRTQEGEYYFTASVPEYDRIVLRASRTLDGLAYAREKTIWIRHEEGLQSAHVWAPELHNIFGEWYIYYSAGDKDDEWAIRPYVLHCLGKDPINDKWEELGAVQACAGDEFSFRAFSLDMTVFENEGRLYCIWAEKTGAGRQISNLYIARMESPVRLETEQVLLTTPDYAWERQGFWVNEGPALLRHGGMIYVTFSASETGSCYCMGMIYAREDTDLLDPISWTKMNHPVLQTDKAAGIYGPGHNCFVKADDGKTDLCVFHGRQYEEVKGNPLYDPNRHTMILRVAYSSQDFPVFSYDNIFRKN